MVDPAYIEMLRRWHKDPIAFVTEVFKDRLDGGKLDEWQYDALDALKDWNQVAFVASKGVGKSFMEACAGWWWMVTRKQAQVICTSINANNLRSGLWKEIGGLYNKSPLLRHLFQFNSERVISKEDPTNWFMEARSWRDHVDAVEQAQALAGLHGPAMMWLGDEAGSYGHAILASGSAMLANVVPGSGREGKILLGGNPTDPKGPLHEIARDPENWKTIRINGDPDNPKRSNRISLEWAKKEIARHGRDNAWVKVSVLGEFPDVGFKNLLGPDDIERSKQRLYSELDYSFAQKRIGVDVALQGDDATVICLRQGLKAGPFLEMRTDDPEKIADRVALAVERTGAEIVYVDHIGIGVSVLRALQLRHVRAVGVAGSHSPTDDRYANKRAEMWFEMAEWVKSAGWLPSGYEPLEKDLMAPEYSYDRKGKTLIEPKEKVKEKLGRSPDYGDALALTFAAVDMSAGIVGNGDRPGFIPVNPNAKRSVEFDPLRSYSSGQQRSGGDYDPLDGHRVL